MEKHYFKHDFYARQDEKLKRVRIKHGLAGIGAFWCITEMLYESNGAIEYDCDLIADELRCDSELVKQLIENSGLFQLDDKMLTSKRVKTTIDAINEKSEKAKQSIQKRWNNIKQLELFENSNTNVQNNNTNVCESNTNVQENNKTIIQLQNERKTNVNENNETTIRTQNERKTNVNENNETTIRTQNERNKNQYDRNTDKIREDKRRENKKREESECVCDNAHTHTHESEAAKNENFEKPELFDVLQYAEESNFRQEDAEAFFNYYEAQGWITGNNMPIKNFRPKLKQWCHENELRRIDKEQKEFKQTGISPEFVAAANQLLNR